MANKPEAEFEGWSDSSQENDLSRKSIEGAKHSQLRSSVANTIRKIASNVKEKTYSVDESESRSPQAGLNEIGSQASGWLNRSADYIEEFEPQKFKEDISKEVKNNPGRSLLIVGAAGLILGALIRRR